MSLNTLFDREVQLVIRGATENDEYGNEVLEDSYRRRTRCRRSLTSSTEDNLSREQQVRRYTYLFPSKTDLSGLDRIEDGDETLEIFASPELANSLHGTHHVEVHAYIIEG